MQNGILNSTVVLPWTEKYTDSHWLQTFVSEFPRIASQKKSLAANDDLSSTESHRILDVEPGLFKIGNMLEQAGLSLTIEETE